MNEWMMMMMTMMKPFDLICFFFFVLPSTAISLFLCNQCKPKLFLSACNARVITITCSNKHHLACLLLCVFLLHADSRSCISTIISASRLKRTCKLPGRLMCRRPRSAVTYWLGQARNASFAPWVVSPPHPTTPHPSFPRLLVSTPMTQGDY